jgi:hypothetical protein
VVEKRQIIEVNFGKTIIQELYEKVNCELKIPKNRANLLIYLFVILFPLNLILFFLIFFKFLK